MAKRLNFSDHLSELFAPLGKVSIRRMFGGAGVFCDGVMFGVIADDTLYFRVDEQSRGAFGNAVPFRPQPKTKGGRSVELPYLRAPDRLLDDPADLLVWARRALEAADRKAPKRKPTSPMKSVTAKTKRAKQEP
jgi:DNA transformation protein and related proteins